ncbi:putative UPF0481 protein At3g02645 [Mercurialis annua]|uniref:putative UPF0481 protein At3g02645 n=1 Tax=Mercurialis annua TaxID=3986 RepID=UPI00215ED9C5|nr:putative UPF0481 protein At3g02645 [Mercurialis annua]
MASADSIINIETHRRISEHSIFNSNFNQEKWIQQMKNILNNEASLGYETNNFITIFKVTTSLKNKNREFYIPQKLALGPYHNFSADLYKLQKCKLHQVELLHQQLGFPEFELLADRIGEKTGDIRGCYDENLDVNDDTLSWIMVIDGLFLLQLLYQETEQNADSLEFIDAFGRKITFDFILKDVMMIENQIPLFVLDCLLSMSKSVSEIESLSCMSVKICSRISPIVLEGGFFGPDFENAFHLLDLLYKMVWYGGSQITPYAFSMSSSSIWSRLWSTIKTLNISVLAVPVRMIDLALKILQLLGVSFSFEVAEEKHLIPRASELSDVKVKFCSTTHGISHIAFVKKDHDVTLRLPTLELNVYSDVIIRNLLAYETITKPETPNFARYIELMGAMIQTVEDVKLLKNEKILMHNGDNHEVLKLFSGIKSSVPSGGKSGFDRSIEELNEYYKNHWKIKLRTLVKKYVYSSWKVLTIFATILLLLLMILQTFCSVYSCHGIFKMRLSSLSLSLPSSF